MVKVQRNPPRCLGANVLGRPVDVLHDFGGLFENIGIQLLDDVVFLQAVITKELHLVGVVDIAYLDLFASLEGSHDTEGLADFLQFLMHLYFTVL